MNGKEKPKEPPAGTGILKSAHTITPIEQVKKPILKPKLKIEITDPGPPKRGMFLVYGASGSGKTTFAGTFPKPFFVNLRAGMSAVRKKKLPFYTPKGFAEMILPSIPENVLEYETVVFDQMTEAARLIMQDALRMASREKPQLQDWQLVIERLRKIIVAYVDQLLDKHVVFIAEEHLEKSEDTGTIFWLPDVPGKFATQIAQFFDCVFHLRLGYNVETKTRGHWMLTEPDTMYPQAKNRFGGLDRLEEPDFDVMWEKIVK